MSIQSIYMTTTLMKSILIGIDTFLSFVTFHSITIISPLQSSLYTNIITFISPSLIIRSWERIFDTDNKNIKIYWIIIRWMLCKINIFIGFYTIKILLGKGILYFYNNNMNLHCFYSSFSLSLHPPYLHNH